MTLDTMISKLRVLGRTWPSPRVNATLNDLALDFTPSWSRDRDAADRPLQLNRFRRKVHLGWPCGRCQASPVTDIWYAEL